MDREVFDPAAAIALLLFAASFGAVLGVRRYGLAGRTESAFRVVS